MSSLNKIIIIVTLLGLTGCQSAYYSAWEKLGVEKRDILVDRVEDARDSQTDAQEQFASALEEFTTLINFDGGELESVYDDLNSQYLQSEAAAKEVSNRIDKVESVAEALFSEWESELELYTNVKLKRDSQSKLRDTQTKYKSMLRSMRKVESSMPPVLSALQNNVLYLKHNLNASAIGALQDEFAVIKSDVNNLIKEMNAAIEQSDTFIAAMKG
jgi:septation ring formation regulator EzrA